MQRVCFGSEDKLRNAPGVLILGISRGQREFRGFDWVYGWMDPSPGFDISVSFISLPRMEHGSLGREACSLVTVPADRAWLLVRFTCFIVNCHECRRPGGEACDSVRMRSDDRTFGSKYCKRNLKSSDDKTSLVRYCLRMKRITHVCAYRRT